MGESGAATTKLEGKRFLVAGGTGDVGSAIVGELLMHGAHVVVPARSREKAHQLLVQMENERLEIVEGDLGRVSAVEQVAGKLIMPVDGVVASLGGWWQGPSLSSLPSSEWDQVMASNLTSHFALARVFVPLLVKRGGCFVQILGGAAEHPVPGSSLISITAAAVAMMGKVLMVEHASTAVFIRQVMITSIVATRARQSPDPSWVKAQDVGALVATILSDPEKADAVTRLAQRSAE